MLKVICPQYCPAPFCLSACPADAIIIAVKNKKKSIHLDTGKCNGCGMCRTMCITWSRDKALERKLPWASREM